MSQTGRLTPNLDHQSTKLLNLTVLQRIDPSIEEILITAAHVTFYGFNIDLNQWSRKDVEGSLFVVKRNTQPRFQFIVMNRRNTDNLVENILGDFEYEIQIPYLLYRNASQEVNGIWFYHSRECEDVANLFSRILDAYAKVPPKPKVSSSKSEFEEFEAFPTSGVIEGPPQPSFTANTDGAEDSSFVNFFTRAMNIGHIAPNVVYSEKAYQSAATIPSSSSAPNVAIPSPAPTQTSSFPLSASSTTQTTLYGAPDPINRGNQVANLVKPSSFFALPSSSALMTPPFSSSTPTQHAHGTPLLQPFPPPAPPLSLTPITTPTPNHVSVNRDKVRDALVMLVQDNQFIDMFYQALLKVNQS